jgi:hypothetical protein
MSAPKKTRHGSRPASQGEPPAAADGDAAGAELEHDSTHLDWITVTHSDRGALWELLRPPVACRRTLRRIGRRSTVQRVGLH